MHASIAPRLVDCETERNGMEWPCSLSVRLYKVGISFSGWHSLTRTSGSDSGSNAESDDISHSTDLI